MMLDLPPVTSACGGKTPAQRRDAVVNRSPQVHLVFGPTGTGKTDRAVSLAAAASGVVVSLDRIQAFPELATGSARPDPVEVNGAPYLFLAERRVADGDWPARDALPTLGALLRHHARDRCAILEGGSISLCRALVASELLRDYDVVAEYRSMGFGGAYLARLCRRAHMMLTPSDRRRSIAEEFAMQFGDARHQWVGTVCGYNVLRQWCGMHGWNPTELPRRLEDERVRSDVASAIARAHYDYAVAQQAAFNEILPALRAQGIIATQVTSGR